MSFTISFSLNQQSPTVYLFSSPLSSFSPQPNMLSATSKTPPCFARLTTNVPSPNSRWIQLTPRKENQRKMSLVSLKCADKPESNINSPCFSLLSCSSVTGAPAAEKSNITGDKLQCLASEFKSLSEPIDRVKRLLHYAALLPPFDESGRVEANRVSGCTARVWLEARVDSEGLVRFKADSDSEITKGFCWCLIWAVDEAAPEEVLAVKAEDLADMNVGLSIRAKSRINTWDNVLMSMQKRTKALVEE